jgi:hypothetical protein
MKPASPSRYIYNGHTGTLVNCPEHGQYVFEAEAGWRQLLSQNDIVEIETPMAALRAETDALTHVWSELCESVQKMPNPEIAQQILYKCLMHMVALVDATSQPLPSPHLDNCQQLPLWTENAP